MPDHDEWRRRWAQRRIGFHRAAVHPALIAHDARFLGSGTHHVLVPFCGKSVDMPYLARRGHRVTGVELVEQAVTELAEEQSWQPVLEPHGPFVRYRGDRVTVLLGDFFALEPDWVDAVDRVWDRAALVAVQPAHRAEYVGVIRRVASRGARVLLSAFTYDQDKMNGPPFSVPQELVFELYRGCAIEVLDEVDAIAHVRYQQAGHTYWQVTTYLIELG